VVIALLLLCKIFQSYIGRVFYKVCQVLSLSAVNLV